MHLSVQPSEQIELVTRAGDAGLSKGINDAIRDSFEEGILRNVSVMANGPALDHAGARLADVDGLCIGVHIAVTAERGHPDLGPVLPPGEVSTLVDENGTLPDDVTEFTERNPDPEEVAAEIEAQIGRVRETGFDPMYLDSHHAIATRVDWLGEILSDLAEREGLIDATLQENRLLGDSGLLYAERDLSPQWLLDSLDAVDPGRYDIVCRPGSDDGISTAHDGLDQNDPEARRSQHCRAFTNPRVRQYVARRGIDVLSHEEAAHQRDSVSTYDGRAPAGIPSQGK